MRHKRIVNCKECYKARFFTMVQWFTENPIVVFYYVANKLEKRSENIKYSLINACGGCSGHENS